MPNIGHLQVYLMLIVSHRGKIVLDEIDTDTDTDTATLSICKC